MAFAHPLDHLVLPTRTLATAKSRMEALGFTVAPRGIHPFGTENCCVYFSGDTFLEPLAVADSDATAKATSEGNVFVARDRAFRDNVGEEGLSAIVFGTADADADHARYIAAGISAGDRLDFSRPFIDSAGNSDIASFRLAFAAAKGTADSFLFVCERVNAPKVGRAALQRHANGVRRIAGVVALSVEPTAQHDLLRIAAGAADERPSPQATLVLPNAEVIVLDPAGFSERFGVSADAPSALRFAAVIFGVSDVARLAQLLATGGIAHHLSGDGVVVPPAPGQGVTFVFKEIV